MSYKYFLNFLLIATLISCGGGGGGGSSDPEPPSIFNPVINTFERISKPGRRIFSSADGLPKINNGLGIAIVSTPKGVMTDIDARKQKVGGEIICKVF